MQELVSSETLNNEEEIIVFEENLKGPKGDKGDKGDDGYTPKKGVDYFTETDKQELIEAVTEDASSEFVQIVNSKTTEFNNNATSKTESFNSNATSKETSYNDNATTKLNEYNENHTSKMTAYNENSAEKTTEFNENAAEKLEEYDNHIEDLDNIVSKNVTNGESIYVDDALKYKIFDCKIDGNVNQTTTTGKQMLQMCPEVHETNGITFTKNEDGSIIINGTATNTAFCNINGSYTDTELNRRFQLKKDSYYTLYLKNQVNGLYMGVRTSSVSGAILNTQNQELKAQQYTGEDDDTGLAFLNVATGTTLKNLVVYPMIAEGQFSELEWEEYTGGEPSPSPDYKQAITTLNGDIKIVQIGQNAYNIANRKNPDGYPEISVDENDWVTIDNTTPTRHYVNFFTSNLKLKTDTDYAIVLEVKEASGDGKFILMSDDQDRGQFEETIMFEDIGEMGNNSVQVYIKKSKSSFEKSADGLRSFIETSNGQSNFITFRISVVEDTSITPETFVYKSYESNEYTIDLQDNELVKLTDDIKDEITIDKNGNVSLSKRIGKVVLNGTENWIFNESGTNYIRFTLFINDLINNQENNKKYVASDYFVSSSIDEAVTDSADANRICAVSNQRLLIKLVNDNVMNLDDFKAWLSENNVTVYYELAEPTKSNLNQLTNFKTYAGVNHFFLETNLATSFEIKYVQDLQKVISKQQEEIDELKTLLSSTATSALLLDNYESDLINEIESEV